MVDHIKLWVIDLRPRLSTLQEWPISKKYDDPKFCEDPDYDIKMQYNSSKLVFFWRTDKELTNCFRCLARLKEIESYD